MKKLFVVCATAFVALSMSSVFAQSSKEKGAECCKNTEAVCVEKSNCESAGPGCNEAKCVRDKKECKNKFGKKNGKKCCKHGDKKGKRAGECGPMKALKGIDLTETQKAKVEALKADLKKDKANARIELGKKNEKLRAKFNNNLRNILTAEQYAKYQSNLMKGEKMRKGDMCGGRKGAMKDTVSKQEYKKGPAPKLVTNN